MTGQDIEVGGTQIGDTAFVFDRKLRQGINIFNAFQLPDTLHRVRC